MIKESLTNEVSQGRSLAFTRYIKQLSGVYHRSLRTASASALSNDSARTLAIS